MALRFFGGIFSRCNVGQNSFVPAATGKKWLLHFYFKNVDNLMFFFFFQQLYSFRHIYRLVILG